MTEFPTDAEIMGAIVQRDTSALEVLYDRHAPTMLAIGLRMLRRRDDAEEVLNQVFWEVWRYADRYDPGRGTPRTYLLLLMRSRCLDRLRKRPRLATVDEPVETHAPPPDAAMEADESRETVRAVLDELSDDQRSTIELAFYEGLSHSEIAERTGQPLGTIKSRIRTGLIRMRQLLRTHSGDSR